MAIGLGKPVVNQYRFMIYVVYMASILIQVDEETLRALDQIAPVAKRQRAEFIRQAIKTALWRAEEERTRRAYQAHPDTESEADDWSNAEEFRI